MATVRIYDYAENGGLALDLRDLLALLGSRSLQAIWTVSPVKLYYPSLNSFQEEFVATGQGGDQLEEHARNRSSVSGIVLTELAKTTRQVIWDELAAVLSHQDVVWVTIRAIDNTFYEVATTDEAVLSKIKSTYKDVRVADGPATSTPISQLPREDDQ